ncbi:MAG: beta-ketoacyl-ACP synthase III [Candidatus Cloacimonadaceae bacterium]|jgi:3-oxoacyl-[acyl-carrier-protein] synthase-3|nr:ketoacyl-ACP synthase III [Candidatus Cloacimonadota bacterium]MDY0126763.1 beta-ketoacyl-ACP synthase III [Candidatus Cloacimonadaceae bacterium]MCB5255360.1 ketoacyl-ACP synthase III [Candidatus Cloacimonadota bacterium]MCK9178143.1 ketoacyl-ACP synthase III [Candidatus Cloacimonadota bacterium]MCK9242101.1 ketoacyl-ACP synthase III [Candidatus Cloacimonadota bacterium]
MENYFAKFSAFGSFAPAKILTNQDLEKIVDTTDEWIRTRTGMVERRMASKEEAASDLAYQAALNAIEASKVKYKEIDMIIVATISGDHAFPSTSCILQHKLGLKNVPAFDLSAGCTGFIYACDVANQYVRNGQARNILVVGVEILTKITNWTDRNTCVLFGDAAGAAVISRAEPTDISKIIDTKIDADGSMGDYLIQMAGGSRLPASAETVEANQHTLTMEGNRVFKSAIKSMYASSDELLKRNNLSSADVDWVIPHQANLRIIEALADKMKVPLSKVIINIQKYGNTSSATVPLAIDEAIRKKKIRRGDILLLTSFGAGLTWGSILARY